MSDYNDDDLVYVDPQTREVVGLVEFDEKGNPISRRYEGDEKSHREFYPMGTYRSMCSAFRLEGKKRCEDDGKTMDEYLPSVLQDSY